jgi:hypothetical protein
MKKYKEFRGEQQYITEVGPLLGMLTGLLGLAGAGYAGYKTAKAAKDKFKGYKETRADKKAREKEGFTMSVKVYNPETDKEESQDFFVDPENGNDDLKKLGYELPKTLTGKIKAPSDDDLDKMEKAANAKSKRTTQKVKNAIKDGGDVTDLLTTDQQTQLATKGTKDIEDSETKATEVEDEAEKVKRDGIEKPEDAEEFFKNNKKAPAGWKDVRTKSEKDKKHKNFKDYAGMILTTADALKLKDKKKKLKKQPTTKSKKKVEVQTAGRVLKFGEFITEGVMNDLLKAGKSKKDSEITLDDGADIPIDPLTSQILVKYIEGLSSSEKNRTIQQIQRTERAFMKVLGKAHENI